VDHPALVWVTKTNAVVPSLDKYIRGQAAAGTPNTFAKCAIAWIPAFAGMTGEVFSNGY